MPHDHPGRNGHGHPVPHHADLNPPGHSPPGPGDGEEAGTSGPADHADGAGWEADWIDLGGEG
jgi:hypothetical protein